MILNELQKKKIEKKNEEQKRRRSRGSKSEC
jgi:hypothetical protein